MTAGFQLFYLFSYSAATTVSVQRLESQRPATVTVMKSPNSSQTALSAPISRHSPHSSVAAMTPPNNTKSIQRDRSPGGRVITPSGNYHPYTPANAEQAQRSRAESLAKLTGEPIPPPPTTINTHQPTPKHMSIKQPKPQTPKSAPASSQKNAIEALFDRYSGGLEYGFERGAGIGGSAGRLEVPHPQLRPREGPSGGEGRPGGDRSARGRDGVCAPTEALGGGTILRVVGSASSPGSRLRALGRVERSDEQDRCDSRHG